MRLTSRQRSVEHEKFPITRPSSFNVTDNESSDYEIGEYIRDRSIQFIDNTRAIEVCYVSKTVPSYAIVDEPVLTHSDENVDHSKRRLSKK